MMLEGDSKTQPSDYSPDGADDKAKAQSKDQLGKSPIDKPIYEAKTNSKNWPEEQTKGESVHEGHTPAVPTAEALRQPCRLEILDSENCLLLPLQLSGQIGQPAIDLFLRSLL